MSLKSSIKKFLKEIRTAPTVDAISKAAAIAAAAQTTAFLFESFI
jgi:hypothetical protein